MYRFGIAGIPLGSKGRTVKDAVENTFQLGLNYLEIQLFRISTQEREMRDFVGMKPKEIDDMLLVDLLRSDEDGKYKSVGLNNQIEEDDIGTELFWSMARDYKELSLARDVAKELDVKMSLHTPYYVDFSIEERMIVDSIQHTIWGGVIADAIDSEFLITHLGLASSDRKKSLKNTASSLKQISEKLTSLKIKPKLCIENSGKGEVIGNEEEIDFLLDSVKNITTVTNISHIYSSKKNSPTEQEEFAEIIETTKKKKRPLYFEFSGVEFLDQNEYRITPIKKGNLKFEPFADALADFDDEITLISFSPLLEHDALYMKVIFERSILKKIGKTVKPLAQ
ncbi:MAG: AP endonuclease [Candidatus Thermoplasmatota archaeon]|jgi:deoxyribonuclease-4|nr:AP endonuclease [Candidatus Thermoplasmatota archaeon]MCL5874117.1 AP endonuclease [Candidatus Thermoplasmatota archaeon]